MFWCVFWRFWCVFGGFGWFLVFLGGFGVFLGMVVFMLKDVGILFKILGGDDDGEIDFRFKILNLDLKFVFRF